MPLLWAVLACNGTLTGMTSLPVYVCPTPVVMLPPPLPTLVPIPGYPTLVPLPTALPPPTVTPYVLQAPAAFYLGDAVFTPTPQSARFRLVQMSVIHTPAGHTIALWELEIKNLSAGAYDVFPAYQSYVSQLVDGATGVWGAAQAAAEEAGLSVTYEAVSLAPNETRLLHTGRLPALWGSAGSPHPDARPDDALVRRLPVCRGATRSSGGWKPTRIAAGRSPIRRLACCRPRSEGGNANMPIVDDVLNGLQIQIDTLWYNLLFSLAGMGWSVQRAFLMLGYTIELINQWLVDHAFTPLIAQTNASLQLAVSLAFVVALLVLGITYLLAAFARLRVVEPKSAIGWYLAGALFFTLGPSLYQGMSEFRRDVTQAFYASTLSGLSATTGTAFTSLDSVSSTDLGLIALCDNFGSYLPVWSYTVDGLDVALAYLRADAIDLMGYPSTPRDPSCQPHPPDPVSGLWTAGSVPWEWRTPGSFFANDRDPLFFPAMTALDRAASIAQASAAQGRLLTAWPLILFGVSEQLVYLLLTIAQGLTFISFGVAILFAFFKKTEVIARSIIDLWIELLIQTVVIALIQALVVTFFLTGTASGNGIVVLGIGLLCLIFMVIVLFSGLKAVWNSFNRLFNAFGQVTGGAVISPGAATIMTAAGAVGAAGLAAVATGTVVGVGSSALAGATALHNGATPAQAAGLTFGGLQPLAEATRTLTRLPGLRATPLGEAAAQFSEGAATRRVTGTLPGVGRALGPLVGAKLLTDYDPAQAEVDAQGRLIRRPMLVPAVGAGLERLTYPLGKQPTEWAGGRRESELLPGFTPVKPKRLGLVHAGRSG